MAGEVVANAPPATVPTPAPRIAASSKPRTRQRRPTSPSASPTAAPVPAQTGDGSGVPPMRTDFAGRSYRSPWTSACQVGSIQLAMNAPRPAARTAWSSRDWKRP